MANYREAFPTFDPATMPILFGDWVDSSWENEPCPCFIHETAGISLWIDFANPADREFDDGTPRFIAKKLMYDTEHGWQLGALEDILVAGETWAEIEDALYQAMRERTLAHIFADHLLEELGADTFNAVRLLNIDAPADVCASHEFCDANMTMDSAFEDSFRRPFILRWTSRKGRRPRRSSRPTWRCGMPLGTSPRLSA